MFLVPQERVKEKAKKDDTTYWKLLLKKNAKRNAKVKRKRKNEMLVITK